MNIKDAESRWKTMKVQAQNFTQKDHYVDALGRLRNLKLEIQNFIQSSSEPQAKDRAECFLRLAEDMEAEVEQVFSQWRDDVAALRQAKMDDADEEMSRPLPN